jgi:hypothetical protein
MELTAAYYSRFWQPHLKRWELVKVYKPVQQDEVVDFRPNYDSTTGRQPDKTYSVETRNGHCATGLLKRNDPILRQPRQMIYVVAQGGS